MPRREPWDASRFADIISSLAYSISIGEQPLVKTAAHLFGTICYGNKDRLSASIICAGWDKSEACQHFLCLQMLMFLFNLHAHNSESVPKLRLNNDSNQSTP